MILTTVIPFCIRLQRSAATQGALPLKLKRLKPAETLEMQGLIHDIRDGVLFLRCVSSICAGRAGGPVADAVNWGTAASQRNMPVPWIEKPKYLSAVKKRGAGAVCCLQSLADTR